MLRPLLSAVLRLVRTLGVLALFAFPPVASAQTVVAQVVEHSYALDPSGRLDTRAMAGQPGRFSPLPAWWHRDPPGVVRWERLDLRWERPPRDPAYSAATAATGSVSVLQLRTTSDSPATVTYAPDDPSCGQLPPQVVTRSVSPPTVALWNTLPLCPGARSVFLHFPTTRDIGPLAKVRSETDATVVGFSSTANAYIVGFLLLIGMLSGLVGTLRNRDLLWAGMLTRSLLLAPYFFQHAAAPPHTVAALMVRIFTGPPPDLLLATAVLGHEIFLACLFWGQIPTGWPRRVLLCIPASGLLATLMAGVAPYPGGFHASLAVAALSLPAGIGVVVANSLHMSASTTRARVGDRWQQAMLLAVVVFGTLNPLLLFHAEGWRQSHFSLLAFNLALMAWLALRAADRRETAAMALLEEKWSRQRADDRAREEENRRLETRDLMLMLTHEIRTPLAVLQLSVDNAAKSPQARQRVHEAIAEMDRLIERCLDTARIDTESAEDPIGPWAASAAVPAIVARSRNPDRMRTRYAPDAAIQGTRPVVINAILSILVDNALRYGAAAADVLLDVAEIQGERRGLLLNVTNPIGPLGPPDAERVFQKYYRGAGAHRQSGAGLGLYLASRLADRLGGELTHTSTTEHAKFTLWIPR